MPLPCKKITLGCPFNYGPSISLKLATAAAAADDDDNSNNKAG